MSFIGRLFGRRGTDPAAAQRIATPTHQRGFRAARPDRLVGAFSAMFSTNPREEIRRDQRGLVNHARHAAQNYDQARAMELLARRNVIGPDGIRMVSDVRQIDSGQPDRPDDMANARIEAAWKAWGRKTDNGSPSICGRLSWWDIERITVTHLIREGGILIREHVTPMGLKLEPLPWDLMDVDRTESLGDGRFIESGVEFDSDGRVVAFHMWRVPPNVGHMGKAQARRRVPAAGVRQIIDHTEMGLVLGIPRAATSLRMMGLSEDFEESALAAANLGARSPVFFETQEGSFDFDEPPPDTTPPDDMELQAAAFFGVPPGVTTKIAKHNYPDQAVGPFMSHMDQRVASSLGVATESLTANLKGANYSSLHHGAQGERDTWRELQRVLVEHLHAPTFSRWLPIEITAGSLKLPMAKLSKFNAATWHPRGWPAVDPLKQANADEKNLANGVTTLTEIAARKGRTVRDLIAERKAERDALTAAGLPDPTTQARPAPPAGAPVEESDNDDD